MANRSRGYYRNMRIKAIERKKRIVKSYCADNLPAYEIPEEDRIGGDNGYGSTDPYWYVEHDGMLAKGKIHCSCFECSFHGTSMQDVRKLHKMEARLDSSIYENEEELDLPYMKTLKNKIRKEANGRYYPKRGYIGTRLGSDKKRNYEEFAEVIKDRKFLDSLDMVIIGDKEVLFYPEVTGKYLDKGDLYIAQRNTGWELLHCAYVDHDLACVFPREMAYPYDFHECRKVYAITNTESLAS